MPSSLPDHRQGQSPRRSGTRLLLHHSPRNSAHPLVWRLSAEEHRDMTNQSYRDKAGRIPHTFYHEPLKILMAPPRGDTPSWKCVKDTIRKDGTTTIRRIFNKHKQRTGRTFSTSQIASWVWDEYLKFVDETIKPCPGGQAYRDKDTPVTPDPTPITPDPTPPMTSIDSGSYSIVDGILILNLSVTSPKFGPLMAMVHSA